MDLKIEIKLYQLLLDRKMTYQELANITGLSTRTISDLCTNKMERIPKTALCKIADALSVDDIREIIDFNKSSN